MGNNVDPNYNSSNLPQPPSTSQVPSPTGNVSSGYPPNTSTTSKNNLPNPLSLGAPTNKINVGPPGWKPEHMEPAPPTTSDGPTPSQLQTNNKVYNPPSSLGGGPNGTLQFSVTKHVNEWWDQEWTFQTDTPINISQKLQLAQAEKKGMSAPQALASEGIKFKCVSAQNELTHIPQNNFHKWFPREYDQMIYQISLNMAQQMIQQSEAANKAMIKQMKKMYS